MTVDLTRNCPGFSRWRVTTEAGHEYIVAADNRDHARFIATLDHDADVTGQVEIDCLGDNPEATEWQRLKGI